MLPLQRHSACSLARQLCTILPSSLTSLPADRPSQQHTRKLAREDGIKAKMAVMQRTKLDQLSPKHVLVLQRTHIPAVQRHLRLFNQQDLADIVWAAGKLGTATCDESLPPALCSLQTHALQAWPHARPWGTLAHRATQLVSILKGLTLSNVNTTAESTELLHTHTLQLLPQSNDRALTGALAAWERRPALCPAGGLDVHAARVAELLGRRHMGVRALVRTLCYWATHVGHLPHAVDAQIVGSVLTADCMQLHVEEVHTMLAAWARLGGVPAALDVAACVDVLRAHNYEFWDQGEPWLDHLYWFDG